MKELKTEFLFISVIILFSLIGHILFDFFFIFLSLAVSLYLSWHLYQLYNLYKIVVLNKPVSTSIPIGLWGQIYQEIISQQNHWLENRKKTQKVVSRFQHAFKNFPDAVLILNQLWEVKWYNSASKNILNKDSGINGRLINHLIAHPVLEEYIQTGNFDIPLEIESPTNKASIISIQLIPLIITNTSATEEEILVIIQDISTTFNLHQTRKDFIANVTHELKTPLTVFKGFMEPMCEDIDSFPAHWAKYIELMHQQSIRMNEIINDLLLLSQLEMNNNLSSEEIINMPQLLDSAIENAKLLNPQSDHQISTNIENNLALKGEMNSIQTIINNLLVNAIKYTPQRSHIKISWYTLSEHAYLVVDDSGEGIAPRHLSRLTERFYRVESGRSREAGGSGLGLAIVNHALLSHQAELKINSEVGHGSTFTCIFPKQRIKLL